METARAEAVSLQTQVDSHASELSEERASASAKVLELEQRMSELNKQLRPGSQRILRKAVARRRCEHWSA